MTKQTRNTNPLLKILSQSLVELPSPSNINYMWNLGSLLGLILVTQLITGIFLAMHYSPSSDLSFSTVSHIMRDVNYGWMMRIFHANSASLFFIFMYTHIGRGIYFSSYTLTLTWMSGSTIFLLSMMTAFLGYTLPWGQMSFWGATVITNLISAVPSIGPMLVSWLWGGFAVNNPTLTRFFTLHFLLPFVLSALVCVHLLFLHTTGSTPPLGTPKNLDKITFHPFFSTKDSFAAVVIFLIATPTIILYPYLLGDPENFTPANPMMTPLHIQPEWYFLFAYAILRSIPNKFGGVLALLASVLVLYTLPLLKTKKLSSTFSPFHRTLLWITLSICALLTWVGARPVDPPFILIGQTLTMMYFLSFALLSKPK